jgi:nucleoside-triphosphatase
LKNNLLITGPPRSGKTTLVKKALSIPSLRKNAKGFLTEEYRRKGQRIGFHILTVPEGKKAILSLKGFPSPYKVGSYGIDLEALEEWGCLAISQGLARKNIIIVDEIGKMELFSEKFRTTLGEALDSHQKVLATIMQSSHAFSDMIKKRTDVSLINLQRENFENVYKKVLMWLDK